MCQSLIRSWNIAFFGFSSSLWCFFGIFSHLLITAFRLAPKLCARPVYGPESGQHEAVAQLKAAVERLGNLKHETVPIAGGPRARTAVRAMLPKLKAVKGISPVSFLRSDSTSQKHLFRVSHSFVWSQFWSCQLPIFLIQSPFCLYFSLIMHMFNLGLRESRTHQTKAQHSVVCTRSKRQLRCIKIMDHIRRTFFNTLILWF